jgi:hypothetical protein
MSTKAISGPLTANPVDGLRAGYGRMRRLLAGARARKLPTAPVPTDMHLRADLGLAPVANPAMVAGCLWLRVL